jgi:hypothetical protein
MKPTQLVPLDGANLNPWDLKTKRLKWNESYSVGVPSKELISITKPQRKKAKMG